MRISLCFRGGLTIPTSRYIFSRMDITRDHLEAARLWAQWNGQTGTDTQARRIAQRLSLETLRRMLVARGITLTQ
jgi:hypothetical protein